MEVAGSGEAPAAPELGEIAGFRPHNDIAAVLGDGRYLIRGRSDRDQPMDSWVERTETGRTAEPRRSIGLFPYDPTDDEPSPVSGIPMSSEVSTAISRSFGPDTVLRVELLPGDRSVANSVGFNGAAYDIEHSLYLTPLPSR
jgi:hypothetical protein